MASPVLAELDRLEEQARTALGSLQKAEDLQALRVEYLGRKGRLTTIMRSLRDVPREEKPLIGQRVNEVKTYLEAECDRQQKRFAARDIETSLGDAIDITLPGREAAPRGHAHPVRQMAQRIETIFTDFGFSIFEGPEVETDFHNFTALNMPADHPARDMQDTFYLAGAGEPLLLRTHTSSVQVRVMESQPPPIRMIAPGAAFRRDTADMTHSPMFHQVEGLCVDEGITFADLKGTLLAFLEAVFGAGVCVRFRPSFFPFTEPSAEIDIGYVQADGSMRIARRGEDIVSQWMEVLGCGMVDPAVFTAVGYDPEAVTGFAFGMGIERLAMLLWGVDDLRHFFESDMRFLRQF
jgi:phenylalanyl-tRNA synthetase alpha chain